MSAESITYKRFQLAYKAGLGLVIVLTFTEPVIALPSSLLGSSWTFWLLGISLIHMTVLGVLGMSIRRMDDRSHVIYVGSQVQTAGYLHTLIGFGAALLVFDTGAPGESGAMQLTNVLYPVGSALSTSVIGWFIGGEIIGRDPTIESDTAVRRQLIDLLGDLEQFTERAQQRHEQYLETLDTLIDTQEGVVQTYTTIQSLQTKTLETVSEQSNAVRDGIGATVESLEQLDTRVSTITASIDALGQTIETSIQPDAFGKSLRSLETVTGSLNNHLEAANTEAKALHTHLDRGAVSGADLRSTLTAFGNEAATEHDAYIQNVREARQAIQDVGVEITNLLQRAKKDAQQLEETPEILQPVRTVSNELVSVMRAVHKSVSEVERATEGVERSLHGVTESGGRLEESLENTTATAKRMTSAIKQMRDIIDTMINRGYRNGNDRA